MIWYKLWLHSSKFFIRGLFVSTMYGSMKYHRNQTPWLVAWQLCSVLRKSLQQFRLASRLIDISMLQISISLLYHLKFECAEIHYIFKQLYNCLICYGFLQATICPSNGRDIRPYMSWACWLRLCCCKFGCNVPCYGLIWTLSGIIWSQLSVSYSFDNWHLGNDGYCAWKYICRLYSVTR